METPTLETDRLLLRAHRLDDFDVYAAMWRDPAVVRYFGGAPLTREQAWLRFVRHAGLWHHLGFGFFALEDKATGAFVGEAGVHELRRDIEPSVEGTLEAGWGLVPAAHGRGLSEEAMRGVFMWAEKSLPPLRTTCIVDTGNAPSLRVAQKLGFKEFSRTIYKGTQVIVFERSALSP
ncbi:GNAT family N-acetyltransferase [Breoghania sp. L-A4]|uniref:GNAT family N-acetyltransferase n=1 Tax=Breoghania sp. L-A4 TaxID=2304600 RepID=UPI000E35B504|nr:GNAT family N-acetyltransferase [Breoghania sp. L-A4]AXS39905.1 N-acetyltransferase [Breoghania sp. L-A4]